MSFAISPPVNPAGLRVLVGKSSCLPLNKLKSHIWMEPLLCPVRRAFAWLDEVLAEDSQRWTKNAVKSDSSTELISQTLLPVEAFLIMTSSELSFWMKIGSPSGHSKARGFFDGVEPRSSVLSTRLNEAKTVDPGYVEIIPLNLVTLQVRT